MTKTEKAALAAMVAKAATEKAERETAKAEKATATAERKATAAKNKKARETAKAKRDAIKASRVRENGVLRPLNGSKCGDAWAVFDDVTEMNGAPCKLGEAITIATMRELNLTMVRSNYPLWRKFNNIAAQGK